DYYCYSTDSSGNGFF
nr:immunoglobulin light chain junction region [Macaca mulatta]MOW27250.1 immunoglobulin light chain junction region [Macaca mulatta]MOW27266.1 immunoglobulin light chain junction region [Macaca mulatta]MOW27424.1 immunoglobulin light chain junction region [Macaca mulatta]MOW27496.1 immunoglobulin light chain junction region [Macaca mulatta]